MLSGSGIGSQSTVFFYLKCVLSTALITAALSFILYGQFNAHRRVHLPPIVNVFLLFVAILFLAYFESGQVAVVNMSTIDEKQSKQLETSHPHAYQVYLNIKRVGMVEKYLMGRQLCVIAIVFFISQLTNFPSMPSILPNYLQNPLIDTGLPGVMLTLILGQLFPQLIADEYTIRFLNIKGSLFFIQIAEYLEQIGIFTNCSWVVAYCLTHYVLRWSSSCGGAAGGEDVENPLDRLDIGASTHNLLIKLKGSYSATPSGSEHSITPNESSNNNGRGCSEFELSSMSNENKQQSNLSRYHEYNTTPSSLSAKRLISFQVNATALNIEQLNPSKSGLVTSSTTLVKLLVSTIFTSIAASIVLYGIFYQKPILDLPSPVLLILLLFCMMCEFYLEGLQVAVLAMQHRDQGYIPAALTGTLRIHQYLLADKKAEIVKRFLIGRQFLVVFSMFTMASITSYSSFDQKFILPQKVITLFVLSGFCGVIFALNTVQLPAQILAKQYPMLFLNLPGAYYVLRLTLCIEQSGILHFGWILFHACKGLFQYE